MSLPYHPACHRACPRCRDWLRSQSPVLRTSSHEAVGHRPFVGTARNGASETEERAVPGRAADAFCRGNSTPTWEHRHHCPYMDTLLDSQSDPGPPRDATSLEGGRTSCFC